MKRLFAVLTAVSVLAGTSLPVCADDDIAVIYKGSGSEDGYVCTVDETLPADDVSGDYTDAADALVSAEADYYAADWYNWNNTTKTLTLKGQLPETSVYDMSRYDPHYTKTIANIAGISPYSVRKIVIESGTKTGLSAEGMFAYMENLTEIEGLNNLNTSRALNMYAMFGKCSSLTSLDLSSFDTGSVADMRSMFDGCSSLGTVIVSSKWSTARVSRSDYMFGGCTSLKGGAGTYYDPLNMNNASYAHIDGGLRDPGYFTSDTVAKPTVAITAAFGGRNVKFNCVDPSVKIYYSFGSSAITTSCKSVQPGDSIFLDKPMTGSDAAMYFKAYKDGKWSELGKWGVLNVQIASPLIVRSGPASANTFKIYTQTKDSYIVYTLDGSVPSIKEGTNTVSVENGKFVWSTSAVITVPRGGSVNAIAVRCGLVTSEELRFTNR
ncbi:MAG: BspA family leucine-rich repeat surface protein [Oscillospiraceae bacterium]|nr:BspA family leucine-rich repeat surface protein [Oscillospiraceae bacterium]